MAENSSIWECLISFPQDWRVNWDYPTGSHLLMILHQCALTDAGKTWITDINVKSQEKVHLMMDPPRICIWGPPNNSIKYQTQFTPKSTRVIHKVCQISLVRSSKCSPDCGRTLLTGWKCRVHKRHHLFGIILGWKNNFQIPYFWVKKLELTNGRKLSKIWLFMDIAELFQGPQISR